MEREKKIVIAGENKEFCEPCEAAFKELGYQTIFCPRDGLQVIKAIRENTPSAVLIDVFMSSIDAFGVMDEISKWEQFKNTLTMLKEYISAYLSIYSMFLLKYLLV